ncbi:spermine/spermidine synthase domain-containing protein [Streptacidiphilus jeojiensis]|uniref:spermine/spermidine synthase domain-containing protein n=1 Tax=Streptacidiphilus jeojiensis TaxID=3229225 RepID=UPI0036D32B8E
MNHSAGSSQPPTEGRPADGRRAARLLVLLAAFVCAACGLVYELELVALGSYLLGDSVTQASVVLSVMVFAMGVGSLLAKRFTRRPATSFALVESALALVGGLSVLLLYGCFVWVGHYRTALVGVALLIGILIGAEIPLLMTLIQRIRRQEAGRAVADLFAADYVGALVGGLAFPFLLLPMLGQATGALLTGAVNAVAGAVVVLWLFPREPSPRVRVLLWGLCGAVLVVLAVAAALTGAFERAARQALYGAPIRFSTQSRYQDIVLTGAARVPPPRTASMGYPPHEVPGEGSQPASRPAEDAAAAASLRMYLGGRLAVCGADQARYHAALVQPALVGAHARVLVLGGGDGLAAAEALREPGVREVTVVEIDPAVVHLGRTDPALTRMNRNALADPRVRVVTADAFDWLRTAARGGQRYDVVVADLPDPGLDEGRKLYTQEFYGMVHRVLAPDGRLAVHAGPVAADAFWAAEATLRSTGLRTAEYAVPADRSCDGPTDWGFILASVGAPRLRPPTSSDASPGSLDAAALRIAVTLADLRRPAHQPAPSTLLNPR